MSEQSESLRSIDRRLEGKAELLCEAARRLPALSLEEREGVRAEVLDFLRHEICDHLLADERVLYPRLATRLGDPLAPAPLLYAHRAIRWWTEEIATADAADADELQRLLYGVNALIRVHLSREEDLYAEAVDAVRWPAGT